MVTVSGKYALDVYVNLIPINEDPLNVINLPGPPLPSASAVTGTGTSAGFVGDRKFVFVSIRDQWGNTIQDSQVDTSSFTADISLTYQPDSLVPLLIPNIQTLALLSKVKVGSTFTFIYLATTSGVYTLQAIAMGENKWVTPPSFSIRAGAAFATASDLVVTEVGRIATAGVLASFYIQPVCLLFREAVSLLFVRFPFDRFL